MDYSVLMSVYAKEQAGFFRESLESIYKQTLAPSEVVIVCDGPLTDELDEVIAEYQEKFRDVLKVIRLETNQGLGNALSEGIKHCSYELVARMDSDDIAIPERCELQVAEFSKDEELTILSGTVLEFNETIDNITGKRELPIDYESILNFSRKRNPFNHPAAMYKKSAVMKIGYSERFHLFEDYYLWIRMLKAGFKGKNLNQPLLYMRMPKDIYKRRGGKAYGKAMLAFHKWMHSEGWSKKKDYIFGAIPHYLVCILPNWMRRIVYSFIH